MNESPKVIHGSAKLFADDTKVFDKPCSRDTLRKDPEISCMNSWSSKWLLKFNETKCKMMHVGKNNPRNDYRIGNVLLEKVAEERDPGVRLSQDLLKPSLKCVEASKKTSRALGINQLLKILFQLLNYPVLHFYIRLMFSVTWNIVFKLGVHTTGKILIF